MAYEYSDTQLNVTVNLPLSIDFSTIVGLKEAIHLFPKDTEFSNWYVITAEDGQLENVKTQLQQHPGVASVENVAIRRLV